MSTIKKKGGVTPSVKIGDVFETRTGTKAEVVHYENASKVWVQFLDDVGYVRAFEARDLKRGGFKNPFQPTIYGKAFFGVGEYKSSLPKSKTLTESYKFWFQMIRRCYDSEYHKIYPTYKDCTVEDYFLNYQNFAKWFYEHPKYVKDYHLDKDILYEGNRQYSRKTCCFVPREINNLLHTNEDRRGEYPIGVSKESRRDVFVARCSMNSESIILGYFDNPEDAHKAYIEAKEKNVRSVAEKYQNSIDTRLYKKLANWSYPKNGRL